MLTNVLHNGARLAMPFALASFVGLLLGRFPHGVIDRRSTMLVQQRAPEYAAPGAWFGRTALVPIILMTSVMAAEIGLAMKFSGGLRERGYIAFGPFLAGAGFTAMVFGPQALLRFVGL